MDVNFRRIPIEKYDTENYLTAEDLKPEVPPVSFEETSAVYQNVRSLLSQGATAEALAVALDSPPYGGDDRTKTLHLTTVLEILNSVRSADIGRIIGNLTAQQQDVLVKYLYKGMATPSAGSASAHSAGGVLLAWFDKTIESTGIGPISRYMCDRRTV